MYAPAYFPPSYFTPVYWPPGFPVVPPEVIEGVEQRILLVPQESRTIIVTADARTISIECDDRVYVVSRLERVHVVPAETRSYTVQPEFRKAFISATLEIVLGRAGWVAPQTWEEIGPPDWEDWGTAWGD